MSTITYHYTYIIVNKNTQMKYIGVRSCSCLPENDSDYMGSSKILIEELQKNPEAFTKTIIDTFPTREIANANEQWLHETYDVARNPKFYNLCIAPKKFNMCGRTHSEEVRKKISKGNKDKKLSEKTKKKISNSMLGEKHHYYGKSLSEEHRKKLSDSKKGKKKPPFTEEHKRNISESKSGEKHPNYGKNRSDATKRKISNSQKGENNPFFGKKHSSESKKKMSETQKGRKHLEETKKKIGESNKGKLHKRITCPYCNKTGGNNNMKRWHFDNCREIV